MLQRAPFFAAAGLICTACASLSPAEATREIEALVSERLAHPYDAADPADPELERRIDALLDEPITEERAVELALLSNGGLRASFETLGVAQAELAQAKAPPNPRAEGHLRFPAGDASGGLNVEGTFTINLIDLLRNVPKSRVAEADLQATKLDVADKVLALAAEAREHFYTLLAADQLLALEQRITELAGAERELAERQLEAGTMNELNRAEHAESAHEARLELARAELEARHAKEQLHRTFGLSAMPGRWSVTGELAPLPSHEISLEALESAAQEKRLELAVLKAQVDASSRRVHLAEWNRFPEVRAGVSIERETDGDTVIGPELGVELPIFNWNRAEVARWEAELRANEQRYLARSTEIASEIRMARERLIATRELVDYYESTLLPLKKSAVEQAQRHYNIMTLGPYDLIRVRRSELEAEKRRIEALRDYWIARSRLERAIGGHLTADQPPPPSRLTEPEKESPSETPPEHHSHEHQGG